MTQKKAVATRYVTDVDAALNQEPFPEPEPPEPKRMVVPPKVGMSEAALRRCRRLLMVSLAEGRLRLEVRAPEPDDRILEQLIVRTPQDVARVRTAYMAKYRIPPENVMEVPNGSGAEC